MPGLGAFALAGAVGGAGQALLDRAKQQREDALRELERQREDEIYQRRRSDALSDYDRQRRDQLADEQRGIDRENARINRASNVYESLFGTESGGNFSAQNDEGYTGRSQFGPARLDDYSAATGSPRIDMETFKSNPQLQEDVEKWHFSDINQFIDQGDLMQYEGQTIGGVRITRSGMIAMAHLGGKEGMKKFLESGGKYNPEDSNGTSLSDYARTHGGLSTDMSEVWDVLADPNTPESVRDDIRRKVGIEPDKKTATVSLDNGEINQIQDFYKDDVESGTFGLRQPTQSEIVAEVERVMRENPRMSLADAYTTVRNAWQTEDVTTSTEVPRSPFSPMRLFGDDTRTETSVTTEGGFKYGTDPEPTSRSAPSAPQATPRPPQEPQAPTGVSQADILAQARDAIAKGAPRAEVIRRLEQYGIDAGLL